MITFKNIILLMWAVFDDSVSAFRWKKGKGEQ